MRTLLDGRNLVAFLCLTLGFLAPFSQTIGAEKLVYEKPQGWERLVEAATREGTVVLYTPRGMEKKLSNLSVNSPWVTGWQNSGTFNSSAAA